MNKLEIQARLWETRQISDQLQMEYNSLFTEWQKIVKAEEDVLKEKNSSLSNLELKD